MKKAFLSLIASALTLCIAAQVSEGGLPPSFKISGSKSISEIASRTLGLIDTATLAFHNGANRLPLMYAVLEEVAIDIIKEGTLTKLEDGGTIRQYRINSPAGKSLQVIFSKYLVPEGAQLFLYNESYSDIKGAFTDYNITEDLVFVTGDFRGDHVIIEYYEPADAPFAGEVVVSQVGQAFIDILVPKSGNTDKDGFIGINCIEGISLQNEKHSVCRYTFNDGTYSYLCSGALINSAGQSLKPYLLTAAHCINTIKEAATIVAYFNYEEAACSQQTLDPKQTISGSSLMTTGTDSDYSLLEFDRNIPISYNPYYAGWNIEDAPPQTSACIHHPGGRPKKLARDFESPSTNGELLTWEGGTTSPSGTHWEVVFDEGITSSGSSGAPLFDHNKKITGQLHGGSEIDYFGRLDYSWNHSNIGFPALKSFLDPDGTGVTSLDGYYPPTNLPDPQFATQIAQVCTNTPVELTGFSAFEPTGWQWSFSPSAVSYSDGTNSSSSSPKVSFLLEARYTVSLKAANAAGEKETTVDELISAGSELLIQAVPIALTDSCVNSFSGLTLHAYGADAWLWTLSDESQNLFYIENNTANPAVIRVLDGRRLTRSTDIDISLTGIHGTCQEVLNVKIPLEAQSNDNISNAHPISSGTSGPFSNRCATVQQNEPIPPYSSCTGQMSWCDEYGTGQDIVENSVWFSYTPVSNQTISLLSTGFDNQIAIYSAVSESALLAGSYKLEAANDDYSDTDYNPQITSVDVVANQKYWIQVDGSAGGSTGIFYLKLSILNSIAEDVADNETKVYPQPAAGYVCIESHNFIRCSSVSIELVDTSGRIVLQDTLTPDGDMVLLQLGNIAPGIYLARIYLNGKVMVARVVV